MMHIWEYRDAAGVMRHGVARGYVDRGGTDVSHRFHRLDDAGKPIRYENGGRCIDIVSGPAMKTARHVGTMTMEAYGYRPGD